MSRNRRALVNVGWGAFNLVVGYVLVLRVGTFDLRDTWDAVAFGAGFRRCSAPLVRDRRPIEAWLA